MTTTIPAEDFDGGELYLIKYGHRGNTRYRVHAIVAESRTDYAFDCQQVTRAGHPAKGRGRTLVRCPEGEHFDDFGHLIGVWPLDSDRETPYLGAEDVDAWIAAGRASLSVTYPGDFR